MSMNKRGDGGSGISMTAVITIVIIVAAGALIIAFLLPALSKNSGKGTGLGTGESNIATEVLNCNTACTLNDKPTYCDQSRDLVFADKRTAKGTCLQMRNGESVLNDYTDSTTKQTVRGAKAPAVSGINDCSALCVTA